jgi:hypothetical protein
MWLIFGIWSAEFGFLRGTGVICAGFASGADRHNPFSLAACIQFDVYAGGFPDFPRALIVCQI